MPVYLHLAERYTGWRFFVSVPRSDNEVVITVENLGYTYSGASVPALEQVHFAAQKGSFTAIMGPNGSGKTTLIKLLIGLLEPRCGKVEVAGKNPVGAGGEIRRTIGYVPQHETVNTRLPVTTLDVVRMAALCRRRLPAEKLKRNLAAALDMVGLAPEANQRFGTLSGGQKQRALIARALVVDPSILVLDEPFAGVDAASQDAIVSLLHNLAENKAVTVLTVVHDINPLVHFINSVVLLSRKMIAFGSPVEVLTAEHLTEAYGRAVPILVCEDGFLHPMTESSHE